MNAIDAEMESVDEEFNNFMHRVTEVSAIVHKLTSADEDEQRRGLVDADRLLGAPPPRILDEDDVVVRVTSDRTVVNAPAPSRASTADGTMNAETFMAEVSKDADRRYRDRLVRTERMETFKARATKAFRRGEFELALCSYNKAIEQIKDSPLLYNNRALTQIKLQRYTNAIDDAKFALRLNENCLRSFLLLAKCHHCMGNAVLLQETITEAKERNPSDVDYIDSVINEMRADRQV